VARCHDVADAGAITFDLVIDEVVEGDRSVARHPHELEREKEWCQHPSVSPRARIHGEREAVGEPVAWRSRWRQRGPSGESAEGVK